MEKTRKKIDINNLKDVTIFDRSNDKIVYYRYIQVAFGRIRFSKGAIGILNLKPNDYIEFIKIGYDWFLCKSDKDTGYQVRADGKNKVGFNITSISMCRLLLKAMAEHDSFFGCLEDTNIEKDGYPLFKIIHRKTFKK